jgi:hypothetical protein
MRVSVAYCKRRLAALWFVSAGLIFFVVLVQSLLGRYGEQVNQAWGWLLPTVMPTLSLIVGVLVFDAVQGERTSRQTDRFLFRLTAGLCAGYLASVFLVIALQPLASAPPVQLMNQANIWLGPFQGLVAATMGAFFVKAAQENDLGTTSDQPIGRKATQDSPTSP